MIGVWSIVLVALGLFPVANVHADSLTCSGSANGGTASGTMAFLWNAATHTLHVVIDNTSPVVLDNGTGVNSPAMTVFGFDTVDPIPTVVSWTLTAKNSAHTPVLIGGSPTSGTGDWIPSTAAAGLQLDFVPHTDKGVKGALYNPLATSGFGGAPRYFTQANLSLVFNGDFALDVHGAGPGGQDSSPILRFQHVGRNGAGSVKLAGTPVPEPSATLLLGLSLACCAGCLGWWRWHERRRNLTKG